MKSKWKTRGFATIFKANLMEDQHLSTIFANSVNIGWDFGTVDGYLCLFKIIMFKILLC